MNSTGRLPSVRPDDTAQGLRARPARQTAAARPRGPWRTEDDIGPSVLITTASHWKSPDWPGSLVRVRFGVDRAAGTDRADSTEGLVFEVVDDDAHPLELLRELITRLSAHGLVGDDPILFCAEPPGEADLEALAGIAERDPWCLDFRTDRDGNLTLLLMGRNVARNPLLRAFFRELTDVAQQDISEVMAWLAHHLVPLTNGPRA